MLSLSRCALVFNDFIIIRLFQLHTGTPPLRWIKRSCGACYRLCDLWPAVLNYDSLFLWFHLDPRDIKAENVLADGCGRFKLADFGSATTSLGNVPGAHAVGFKFTDLSK
jgi:serine/threonine protein kinase